MWNPLNGWTGRSYEGAERFSERRSAVRGYVQDVRFDADTASRWEIIRKSRSFERNDGLCSRLCDVFEQFTVGTGLNVIPATSDEKYNGNLTLVWDEWQRVPDLSSRHNFSVVQSMIARRWWFDGECYIIKTHGSTPPFRPRIQIVETHRVGTPPELYDNPYIIDGHELNPDGRPIAYYIATGLTDTVYRRIPAEQVIHLFEPDRPGQLHGLPFCYPVINPIIDLGDLECMEMIAAKDAAEKSNVITTENGEAPKQLLRSERFGHKTQKSDGTEVEVSRLAAIAKALGGRTISLKKGESFNQFQPTRPSPATQEYWDYIINKICIGHGIPRVVAFPGGKYQGTVVRGEYDLADNFFRCRSSVIGSVSQDVYNYSIGWHKDNDSRLRNPPKDFLASSVRPPRAVSVDVGRNSIAMLAELAAGATTLEDIYAKLGQDWRERVMQRGKEALYIKTTAKELGVTPAEIREQMKVDTQPKL